MPWHVLLAAALGFTTGRAAPAAQLVNGRCADGRAWVTSNVDQEQMLGQLNLIRADAARPPLTRAPVLDRMAMAHAVDMACRDYFDHVNPERQKLQDRLKSVSYGSQTSWRRLAEVIGTSGQPRRQVERWLDSRAHRRAVLEEEFDRVGIGLVRVEGGRFDTYWVVEFMAEGG